MIASTAPRTSNTGIKAPTVSSAPPLQFLQGGGQISDYRFTSGPYAGMTVNEVRGLVSNFSGQVQNNFGPKKPDTMTGSNSTDQALGLVAGVGAPLAAGAAYNYFAGAGTAAATGTGAGAGAGTAGASTLGNLSLSQALGLGGSGTATTAGTAGATGAGAGTAGAGTAGATGAGTASGLSGVGAFALPAAAVVAGGAGIQDTIRRTTDGNITPTDVRQIGATLSGPGAVGIYNAIGKPLGVSRDSGMRAIMMSNPITRPLAVLDSMGVGIFGSKKAQEKYARKEGRLGAQNAGLMNADSRSKYNLASGGQFDIREFKKNSGKDAYNVDWSGENANRGDQVGLTNALANALIGGKGGVRSAISGELYNAYNSDGNFDANIKGAYDKAGGREAVYGSVAERWKRGELTAQERDANFAAIDKLYGIKNTSNARWENSQNLSQKDKDRNTQELANSVQPATKAPAQAANNSALQANVAANKPSLIKGPPKDGGAMLKNKKKKK
jgi:hypothetical protein